MNEFLVNSACDELDEFRMRNTDNAFIQNLKFKSTKSLSRAEVKDITIIYDGPKNAELIELMLPNLGSQTKLESTSTIKRSNKSTNLIPENAEVVDVFTNSLNMTCLRFNEVLQIEEEDKNIYSMCPYGCAPKSKVKPSLMKINPMNLHR